MCEFGYDCEEKAPSVLCANGYDCEKEGHECETGDDCEDNECCVAYIPSQITGKGVCQVLGRAGKEDFQYINEYSLSTLLIRLLILSYFLIFPLYKMYYC